MLECYYADVAQSVVHLIRNQKVASSNLAISSNQATSFKGVTFMKVIKKPSSSFELNSAHGGEGTKKVLVAENEISNVQGITKSCLEPGAAFSWHKHDDCTECMYVLQGNGTIRDEDDTYPFSVGDFFIFPRGVYHEPQNTGTELVKAIFIRIK